MSVPTAVAPEVMCGLCRIYNRADRVFCLNCGKRLIPSPPGTLTADDFASEADRNALETLKAMEPVPRIVGRFVAPDSRKLEAWLSRNALRVSPPSRLDTMIRACAEVLGIETLPRAYVAPFRQLNAFTTGKDESPLMVICAPLLDVLSYAEMEGLVAHELAHVRSSHVLYHSLAESLATGAQLITAQYTLGLLALPVRMLLLSWYRESEVSADRAAALVLGGYGAFESLMTKLSAGHGPTGGGGAGVAELLQTHPTFGRRVRLVREFCASGEYAAARARMGVAGPRASLAVLCKYCGTTMPRVEVFCPNCGQSAA